MTTNSPPPAREELLGCIPDDDQPFYGPDDADFYDADGNKAASAPTTQPAPDQAAK